jgi:hypothetical protein
VQRLIENQVGNSLALPRRESAWAALLQRCERSFPVLVPESSTEQTVREQLTYFWAMPQENKDPRPKLDLEAEALTALEAARTLPPGPARNEAMKQAGILRNAADLQGIFFAKRGRPAKT